MDRHTVMKLSPHIHNISVHEMVHSFTHMIIFKGAVIFLYTVVRLKRENNKMLVVNFFSNELFSPGQIPCTISL